MLLQQQKAYAEQTFGEASTMLGHAELSFAQAAQDFATATQGITDIQNMISGANVATLVNLPYNADLVKYGKSAFNIPGNVIY